MKKRGIVKVIIMNSRNIILKILTISQGGTSSVQSGYKRYINGGYQNRSSLKLLWFHNHPSGETDPSTADIEFTKRLEKSSRSICNSIVRSYHNWV